MTAFVLLAPHGSRAWADAGSVLALYGETRFVDLTRDDSIESMARRVLAEAPDRFALAGHCLGGFVALEILRISPARIERLALLNTSCRADSPQERERRARRLTALEAQAQISTMPDVSYLAKAARWMAAPDNLRNEKIRAQVDAALCAVPLDAVCLQQRAVANRRDQHAALATAPRHTLILGGALDRLTPLERSQEMHAYAPWARYELLSSCAHLSPIESPIAVQAALASWATV